MPMVTYMKENGRMIRHMDVDSTNIRMVLLMMVNGHSTNNMERVLRCGQTEQSMKVTMSKERNMVSESLHLQMAVFMKVNLDRMKYLVKVIINGLTRNDTQGNGPRTKCMEEVS